MGIARFHVENGCKRCTKCLEFKPFPDGFFRDRSKKLGYRSICKVCDQSVSRSKEAQSSSKKRWVERNGHNKNKESKRLRDKRYRQSDKGRMSLFRQKQKRRSKSGDLSIGIHEWEATLSAFGFRCAYCGNNQNITKDHFIPLKLGGETKYKNVIPCCRSCNCSKQDTHPCDWCDLEAYQQILSILASL